MFNEAASDVRRCPKDGEAAYCVLRGHGYNSRLLTPIDRAQPNSSSSTVLLLLRRDVIC